MVTCNIKPRMDNVESWPYSQIPILAWGLERVFKRNNDKRLIEQCLKPMERFHEWYWRERDITNIGLIAVGAYNGKPRYARWETFDDECNMDGLVMTKHPTRKGDHEGPWYGNICITGNTSYLILAERSLMRLAAEMGDNAMAARRKMRTDKAVQAVREHMWDDQTGTFLSVERDTLKKIPVGTIGSWMPLHAGIPTQDQAKRMAEVLQGPNWQTPLPVPTVDRKDSRWSSRGFWRGDVWPATNYQIASGLADYGFEDLAAEICDKTIANAIRNGISERYDSVTGRTLGVPYLGMTCTIVTMMLDGLSRKHTLQLRKT
jgi:putative isomerase